MVETTFSSFAFCRRFGVERGKVAQGHHSVESTADSFQRFAIIFVTRRNVASQYALPARAIPMLTVDNAAEQVRSFYRFHFACGYQKLGVLV
jgi:hypothetical protein